MRSFWHFLHVFFGKFMFHYTFSSNTDVNRMIVGSESQTTARSTPVFYYLLKKKQPILLVVYTTRWLNFQWRQKETVNVSRTREKAKFNQIFPLSPRHASAKYITVFLAATHRQKKMKLLIFPLVMQQHPCDTASA
jgi:hypothetical protein